MLRHVTSRENIREGAKNPSHSRLGGYFQLLLTVKLPETGCIVTSEEHSVLGGLGAAVCEFVSGTCPVPVVRHGVNDTFGRSGTANAVLEYFKITPEEIANKAKEAIALKG